MNAKLMELCKIIREKAKKAGHNEYAYECGVLERALDGVITHGDSGEYALELLVNFAEKMDEEQL